MTLPAIYWSLSEINSLLIKYDALIRIIKCLNQMIKLIKCTKTQILRFIFTNNLI